MALGNVPTLFISSTCYDLKQIRVDIKAFIESFGIQPFLSEYDSFPVNPDIKAVENCLQVVDQNADLFVLIVGSRYGPIQNEGKSVTNMEYLRARAKGIPIYVFVEKSILNILPIWKDNPDGNFTNTVDSTKLFEFVDSVRSQEGVWVFPFESAQNIIETLRRQLAYLFMDALQLRQQVKTSGLPDSLSTLRGNPLRLIIEKGIGWEFRLFASVLQQEIAAINQRRLDLKYGIALGRAEYLHENQQVFRWISRKMSEATRIVEAVERIVSAAFQEAVGEPGSPGDPERIVYVARRLGHSYEHAVEWKFETSCVGIADDEFIEIVRIVGTFLDSVINKVEEFSQNVLNDLESIASSKPDADDTESITLSYTIEIEIANIEEYHKEFSRLRRVLGIDYEEDYE